MDNFGNWAVGTLVVCTLALVFGSFLLAFVCLVISAEVAAVLFTSLRAWLGIREPRAPEPRRRVAPAEPALEPVEP
jgi:hypothetical protein